MNGSMYKWPDNGQTIKMKICTVGGLNCMTIRYKCKHCRQVLGTLEQQQVDTNALGWQHLSVQEKKEMIHYLSNGDIEINAICEDCQDTLAHNPEYHALDYFIQ